MSSDTDVRRGSLACSQLSSLSQSCSVWFMLCAGHSSSFTPILANHFYRPHFVHRGNVPVNRFGYLVPMNRNLNATTYKDILENSVEIQKKYKKDCVHINATQCLHILGSTTSGRSL